MTYNWGDVDTDGVRDVPIVGVTLGRFCYRYVIDLVTGGVGVDLMFVLLMVYSLGVLVTVGVTVNSSP